MKTTHQWIQGVLILGALSAPIAAEAASYDGTWSGQMTCGTGGQQSVSSRHLKIKKSVITYTQGQEGVDGFESLTGTVNSQGTLLVQGTYHWEETKGLWFYGQMTDTGLTAAGWRGRNWCQLDLIKTSARPLKAGV